MKTAQDILDVKGDRVATVGKNDSVLQAAEMMNTHRIGAVVVIDGEKVVGIFSERDVLNRVVAEKRDPVITTIGEVMTSPMACCNRATTLSDAKAVMTSKRIRHLPVVEAGRLYGLISSGDVLAMESAEQQTTIEYLHEYLYGRH